MTNGKMPSQAQFVIRSFVIRHLSSARLAAPTRRWVHRLDIMPMVQVIIDGLGSVARSVILCVIDVNAIPMRSVGTSAVQAQERDAAVGVADDVSSDVLAGRVVPRHPAACANWYGLVLTFVSVVHMDLIAAPVSTSRLDRLWRSFNQWSGYSGRQRSRADNDRD
jgi:hypothetical protein